MYYKTLLKQWFVSSSTVLQRRDIKLLNLKTIPRHLLVLWAVRDYMKSIFFAISPSSASNGISHFYSQ